MYFFTKLFNYVLFASTKYNIDESHGIMHSMNVLHFAHEIFEAELPKNPQLHEQRRIIYTAAVLHDMCDKKYMDERDGITEIAKYIGADFYDYEVDAISSIIGTMSYSKVKKSGFPNLGTFQSAYHVVREADLLAAYDFDRCMIYDLRKKDVDVLTAYQNASDLFETRIFRHNADNLFVHDYSKKKSLELESQAHLRIGTWRKIMCNTRSTFNK